jgi:outer membrane protein OmpA-like peptidoglycan-associated protein
MCSVPFSWYSDVFNVYLEDIIDLDRYRKGQNGGEMSDNNINHHFWMDLHPGKYNPGTYSTKGYGNYRINSNGAKIDLDEIWMPTAEKSMIKVSIWRQGQRLRVYLNENKILDLPKILPADMKPNLFVFEPYDVYEEDKYFIGNLRIAVGNPDTRNKLLTDGKLVTSGILFSVNSAEIKTESYGVLKEIAGILNESKDVKVKIVGHTDSDGDDAMNLELSKKRAEAVKKALVKDFGIDAGRLDTDGKGEQEPLAPNTDSIAKANNRRVEFLKTN